MRNNALKLLLIIAVVLLGWLIYQNLEQYEERVDYGWSEQAQRNPYLALHQFLDARGTAIESVTHFSQSSQLAGYNTLLIPDTNYIRLPSQQREILSWIEAGGHLIVGIGDITEPAILSDLGFSQSWSFWDEDDYEEDNEDDDKSNNKNQKEAAAEEEKSLADRLREQNEEILRKRDRAISDEDFKEEEVPVCKSFTSECNAYLEPEKEDTFIVELLFEGIEGPLHINFPWQNFIKHEAFFSEPENEDVLPNPQNIKPFYWDGDDEGIHFAQTHYGEGMISILSDFDIWQSNNIAHFDHAFFLTVLVNRDDRALLLYGKYMPSLDVLIYRHFFHALISFLVVLILALVYYSRRFGPVYSLTQNTRRSRGEQFMALAQFRWKHQDSQNLLQHIRADVKRLATRHWQNFNDLSAKQQHQQLASMCDLPITTIEKIMQGDMRFNENEFTHMIRALQILRNSL
ncbi:hypothetical protein TDB9533_04548 [Thalassocella blandensis]|nr:hypothetical protein TDB9533_04548 [Thalassocella blandensis]